MYGKIPYFNNSLSSWAIHRFNLRRLPYYTAVGLGASPSVPLTFFSVNVEADAINTLEGTFYYQGGQTVDDYLDSFQTLVSNVGYTDLRTLVVKF